MSSDLLKEVISRNKEYSEDEIRFTDYCLRRMNERGIEKSIVLDFLSSEKDLLFVEPQEKMHQDAIEQRYKIVYRLSGRYNLIVIITYCERILKVINVIKTSKDWEKLWRKKAKIF